MKKKLIRPARRLFAALAALFLLPYAVTLAWSGKVTGMAREDAMDSGRIVYLSGGRGYVDAEEYLIGAVAGQIPMDYETEAVKAQAIIARTWLYRQMDGGRVSVDDLNMEYLTEDKLEELWGEADFLEYYEKARRAVEETAGMVILSDGRMIEPLFHRISAGKTRAGDSAHPYLQSVDSDADIEADGYLTVKEWTPEEFAALVSEWNGSAAAQDGAEFQLVSHDGAGYVSEYQIGGHVYSGDEVREMLSLPSPAFSLGWHEGRIRAVCRGQGHALGLSQYGASRLAREGRSAEEILKYYYQDITVESV